MSTRSQAPYLAGVPIQALMDPIKTGATRYFVVSKTRKIPFGNDRLSKYLSVTQNKNEMNFCTVINCMDGRVQLQVNKYLQKRLNVEFVDSITEAGPVRIISDEWGSDVAQSMVKKVELSIKMHQSVGIAIVCHHDCAGNPITLMSQLVQLKNSVSLFKNQFNNIETIGLSVDENWQVNEIIS